MYGLSKGSLSSIFSAPTAPIEEQKYLTGLRGVLTLQAFLWVFLSTFVPTTVKDSSNTDGPEYQTIIRKTLSVLLWNESLIYSAFVLLSGRTLCIPFFKSPGRTTLVSAVFRRGLRLYLPVAVCLAITKVISSTSGWSPVDLFKSLTDNKTIETPYYMGNILVYFNSVFNLFWTRFNFATQAGSLAFPSQTLWIVSVIYSQSYTVYMSMLIVPYTRPQWRVKSWTVFIITAFWVQSWAWYTITGMFLADAIMNMDFKTRSKHGMPLWKTNLRIPIYMIYIVLMAGGLTMQYLWTAWRPGTGNIELEGHAGLYYTGGLNTEYSLIQPQARDDNYCFLLGFFLLMETSNIVQAILSNPFFLYLGRRSLSFFLVQSIIIYTVGIKVYMAVVSHSNNDSGAVVASLVTCIATTVLSAEIFYRMIDYPSIIFAKRAFEWIVD